MPNELAVQETPLLKASTQLSSFLGIETGMMLDTIKAQCFKSVTPDKVSDEQLAAFVSIAAALRINPLLPGMLYAFPGKNGSIEPIIGPDGVFMLLTNNPDIVAGPDGSAWWTVHGKEGEEETCTGSIFHKHKGLIKKTIRLSEWEVKSNPNWVTRPYHMADIRAIKQCARQIIHGLPMDDDELTLAGLKNVTDTDPARPTVAPETRTDPATLRKNKKTGAAASDPANAPIDVQATAGKTTPPPQKEPDANPHGLAAAKPTMIEKDQRMTVKVKIESATYEEFAQRDKPSRHGCKAVVSGGFVGTVYHMDGGAAVAGADGVKLEVQPVWKASGIVTLELIGRKSASMGIVAVVEKIVPDQEPDMP